jgi:hypothetical protein
MITFFGNGMLSCTGDLRLDWVLGDYNFGLVHYAFTFHLGMLLSARIFSEDDMLKIKIHALIISRMHVSIPHLHARQFLFVE